VVLADPFGYREGEFRGRTCFGMTRNRNRMATLEKDGWTLEDAEARYARGDDLFWMPTRSERERLEEDLGEGLYAKLIFLIQDTTPSDRRKVKGERMWVEVLSKKGALYHGHLANEPFTKRGSAKEGMPVWFGPEHVIDLIRGDGEPASRQAEVVECETHGLSETCYVCAHLVGARGLGFHTSENPDKLRPDAWCDECETLLQEAGSWEALGDREPKISSLCGGCYDRTRELNLGSEE
jgi:hypothetical protein